MLPRTNAAGMSDVPQQVGAMPCSSTEVELSEAELFQLATGEAVTVDLAERAGPRSVQLTVTPPEPLSDRE